MTEAEWLAATDPAPMLEELRGKASDRKLRLFACACCWDDQHPLWEGKASRIAVAIALRYAEGLASASELELARTDVRRQIEHDMYGGEPVWDPTYWTCAPDIQDGVKRCAFYSSNRGAKLSGPDRDDEAERLNTAEALVQTQLLRCTLGNPFRPVALDSAWLTPTAVAVATGIYADRAFDRLPVLADALEDAGCDSADLLAHCRGPGPHARGCWVVDLVLGKA